MNVSLMFVFSGNFSFETGLLHHHHVISMHCTLIEHSSQPNSARGIAYLL